MANTVSLERVEALVTQLPPQEQLRLLSSISARLAETGILPETLDEEERQRLQKERERKAAAVLRACDRAARAFTRKTDSAETIRRMREERAEQLCSNE